MPVRFRKSFKIAPGVKVNIGKKGTSVTFGGKGAHVTVNDKGKTTTTVGVPGTGLSYTETAKSGTAPQQSADQAVDQPEKKKHSIIWWIFIGWWWKIVYWVCIAWWWRPLHRHMNKEAQDES